MLMSDDLGPTLGGTVEGDRWVRYEAAGLWCRDRRQGFVDGHAIGPLLPSFLLENEPSLQCPRQVPFASESYRLCFSKAMTNSLLYPQTLPLFTQLLLCTQLHHH